jgi:hypothetical protein
MRMESRPEWREFEDAIMGNVAAPVRALPVDEWCDGLTPDAYRVFHGSTREVPVRYSDDNDGVRVTVRGTEKADGRVDEHGIFISGGPYDLISADEARGIAAALVAAADEIDGRAKR